jgi:putative molybdopterin biosynthesis protein
MNAYKDNQTLMSTHEVAEYLRLRERKIYELVAQRSIPHSRVLGKLLFPRALVDEWVNRGMAGQLLATSRNAPSVVAGSSDPLLEWAIRESRCGLATLTYGSTDGIDRLIGGQACAAALHLPSGNKETAQSRLAHLDCVMIRWAKREQGLVLAPNNPRKIKNVADLKKPKVKTIVRQTGAGSALLFDQLLDEANIELSELNLVSPHAPSESDVATAILDGRADVGLAVKAVAQQFHLHFIPLATEALDIAILRGSYFDPPLQKLFEFTRTASFQRHAKLLAGYDIQSIGQVQWNA